MSTPPAWLPQLLTIRTANPGQPPAVLVNLLQAHHGVTTDDMQGDLRRSVDQSWPDEIRKQLLAELARAGFR